jgi:hypothetical protein
MNVSAVTRLCWSSGQTNLFFKRGFCKNEISIKQQSITVFAGGNVNFENLTRPVRKINNPQSTWLVEPSNTGQLTV